MKPVIKWSGSKREQAHDIVSYIPDKFYETYYEPFCGGCSILAYIIERKNLSKHFKSFVCSDLNYDLITSYNLIKENPKQVITDYKLHWNNLNKKSNSIDDKKTYFELIRKRLNQEHNPSDFIFIMRTTTNGMPRYNKNGEFNNSFHLTRNGIEPNRFEKIVNEWSFFLKKYDVKFICCSFDKINASKNDFVYLDPPYQKTKGMYFGSFDNMPLFSFLERLESDWMLSYDGIAGDNNLISDVPKNLYKKHLLINSGNSSFRRVIGKNRFCNVKESLYLSFEPEFKFIENLF